MEVEQGCGSIGVGAEWRVGQEREIDGVSLAVVPPAAHAAIASHLTVAHQLHLGAHQLLPFAQVGHAVFAEEVGGIHKEKPFGGVVETIERAALCGRNLRAYAALEGCAVVAQGYGLLLSALRDSLLCG